VKGRESYIADVHGLAVIVAKTSSPTFPWHSYVTWADMVSPGTYANHKTLAIAKRAAKAAVQLRQKSL